MSKYNCLVQDELLMLDNSVATLSPLTKAQSGTFSGNMSLPVHRWFRYSAGFSAEWVEKVLTDWRITDKQKVLDPFAGSGTVSVVCDVSGIPSISVEAHPMVARILKTKLLWATPPARVSILADRILKKAQELILKPAPAHSLLERSYDAYTLASLISLKRAWIELQDGSNEAELVWLVLTSILRSTSKAGTAQWQYILPNKTKKRVLDPIFAFKQQIEIIKADLRCMQEHSDKSLAKVISMDVRKLVGIKAQSIDAVITSPPYANNYDYADALRFEMTFWGDVTGWGDIHNVVRRHLLVSSSQHSSRDKLLLDELIALSAVSPIRSELAQVTYELAEIRKEHGGQKHYHTMVAAYCRDISLVLQQLRRVCKVGSRMCWVIGDSAPYGIYCPIDIWIGKLAVAAGFVNYRFEKIRDRNIKWKNRKHRVPLKEGLLWIEG